MTYNYDLYPPDSLQHHANRVNPIKIKMSSKSTNLARLVFGRTSWEPALQEEEGGSLSYWTRKRLEAEERLRNKQQR